MNIRRLVKFGELIDFIPQCFHFQIGPIPADDGIGKEIVTKITTSMRTNKQFYTDSNGRDFIQRVCCVLSFIYSTNQPIHKTCLQVDFRTP